MGKTAATLEALSELLRRGAIRKVLIIAPKTVIYDVWPEEIRKWSNFSHLTFEILHGPKKEEKLLNSSADIYLVNPEGLDWLLGIDKQKVHNRTRIDVDMARWKSLGFDALVIDELTKFKNHASNRFKALRKVHHTFTVRWGLTGSLASNGLLWLFGQTFILDQGRTFGPYVTHYRAKYFEQSYNGFSWDLRDGAEEQIYEAIKPIALRMDDSLLSGMPKLIVNNIRVKLPDKAMKLYREVRRDLTAQLESGSVTAANMGVATSKCRQIASGAVFIDEDVEPLVRRQGPQGMARSPYS